MPLPRICIVGQLVGRNKGFITTQGQILADALQDEGFEVVSVSSKLNRLLRLVDVVQTMIQKRRSIDLVIIEVYSGLSFVLADIASLIARIFGLRSVFFLHGGNLPEFADRFPRWTRRVLSRASSVVAPSTFLAEKMERSRTGIKVIPNIVALEKFNFRLRSSIRPALLWMRSFHDIYNPELALRAFALVKYRFADATLVMAGPDKGMLDESRKLARELGLAGSVSFPGFLNTEEKSAAFDNADIFLNTTRIDNMPVGVVEACAAGLPVVATDVGGLSSLLANRHSGILVKGTDPETLAAAITEVLEDPDLSATLSRNGRVVAENSSWPNVLTRWRELFDAILDPNGAAAEDHSREALLQREA